MNQPPIVNIIKSIGLSPLDAIKEFKKQYPEYENIKLGYAGRLDPMAQGVLLVMVGEENKKRDKYLKLNKEYKVQMVLGIETDSYDVLGKIVESSESQVVTSKITKTILSFIGKQIQVYPPYSSQTIGGVRMYKLARENKLDGLEIPKKQVEIYSIKIDAISTIKSEELQQAISAKLDLVIGDFRQEEIRNCWSDFLKKTNQTSYQVIELMVNCSSGTYIRSLVHDIGYKLGTCAFVYNLVRTKVGEHLIKDSAVLS